HAQRVRSQPRQLLDQIPGLTVREVAEGDMCCGSAGIYNLTHPEPARELGDRKAANVAATQADLLVTSNPGCLLQITDALARRGRHIATAHLVLVLDASLRGTGPEVLLRGAGETRPPRWRPRGGRLRVRERRLRLSSDPVELEVVVAA